MMLKLLFYEALLILSPKCQTKISSLQAQTATMNSETLVHVAEAHPPSTLYVAAVT